MGPVQRVEYSWLHRLRDREGLKDVPVMALTATATPNVQKDIINQLKLRIESLHRSITSFDRTNLKLSMVRKYQHAPTKRYDDINLRAARDAFQPLVREITDDRTHNSTIIYTRTRKGVEEIAKMLEIALHDICKVLPYHAKLPRKDLDAAHEGFLNGQVQIIVLL